MRKGLGIILVAMITMLLFITPCQASPDEYLIWYHEQYNEDGTSLMIVWLYKMAEAEPNYDFYIIKSRIVGMKSDTVYYVRADIWSNGVCNDWEPKNGMYFSPVSLSITIGGVGFGINIPAENVGTTEGLMPTFGWKCRTTIGSPDKEFVSSWYVPDGVDFAFSVAGSEWFTNLSGDDICCDAIYVYYPYEFDFKKLTISAGSHGTTSPKPGEYKYYPAGFVAGVWGRPYYQYGFDHWVLDGATKYGNPITVTMDSDHSLKAYFALEEHYLTISAGSHGTTDPSPGSYEYEEGTSVYVRAIPDSGYSVDYWVLDGEIKLGNSMTVTMNSDHSLEAYFTESGGGSGPGCPFVYTWNGTAYAIDNNLLGDSEASGGADVEDYYRLEQPLVCRDGKYGLLIREFEQEHSYLDQVELMAVDHESDVHVAVTHGGEILTYKEPSAPVSVVDNDGESWLDVLKAADGFYYKGFPGDHLLIDFGDLDVSQGAKLVLRDDYKFKDAIFCVHVQIFDADDGWKDIATFRTRTYWATEIVDLSSHLPDANGELKVRLYFTGIHKIDYVGLDTTKQDDFDLHHANLVSATHSEEGSVKTELSESDGIYAELVPGKQIELAFTLPENSKDTRTYIIYAKGRYDTIS